MDWVLHLAGVLLWVGGLMAAGLMRGPSETGKSSTQRRLLMTMALPGLVLAVLGGLGLAMRGGHEVLTGGWFHAKLLIVVVLIVLHVLLAKGKLRGVWLTPVIGLLALVAIVLAHLKPF